MKKTLIAIAIISALFCTACTQQSEDTTVITQATTTTAVETTAADTTAAETTAEETTTAVETTIAETTTEAVTEEIIEEFVPDEDFIHLKSGTWLAYGAGDYRYFFFNDDGETGSVLSADTGMGSSFSFEVDDDRVIFHMGAIDDNSPATVEQSDEDHAVIKWHEGIQEELTYVSADSADTFVFYSNDELGEMAVTYYKSTTTEDTTGLEAGTMTNEDGTVTIQLYINLGDHNSTMAWYTIDRVTAAGTDAQGNAVSFK